MPVPGPRACIDFTELVEDDDLGLKGEETFTIMINGAMAVVIILDDDGRYIKSPPVYVYYRHGKVAS